MAPRDGGKETEMSEFLYLFRSTPEQARDAMGTPERAQQAMQTWMAWVRELEASGHLKDPGQPLERTGKVLRGPAAAAAPAAADHTRSPRPPQALITDGPYAEAKDIILGFMIVLARDLDEAVRLAEGCPLVAGGGSLEIRPIMK